MKAYTDNPSRYGNKKILLLATGGTIASADTGGGLAPSAGIADILRHTGSSGVSVTAFDLMAIDSSNMQPGGWVEIARRAAGAYTDSGFDGVVITHGTDTMAYTASALSFMLRGIGIPVVLTGSQLPASDPLSDAPSNLNGAIAAACGGANGVYVFFDRKLIPGCRAVKTRTESFDAFECINSPLAGKVTGSGLNLYGILPASGGFRPSFELDSRVFLLKLIPGFDPAVLDLLRGADYHGFVIEAFGAGGMEFIRNDLTAGIRALTDSGIPAVVVSQCLYEQTDLDTYEVGRRALDGGAVAAADMTTEAAVTKLMWALPEARRSGDTVGSIRRIFAENIAGEVTL